MADAILKTCAKCGARKPLSEFHRDPRHRDGCASQCKACYNLRRRLSYAANPGPTRVAAKEYRAANREGVNERARQRRLAERERARAADKRRYATKHAEIRERRKCEWRANREKNLADQRGRYAANPALWLDSAKRRYAKNPAEARARVRAWQIANRGAVNARCAMREALKQQATPVWADRAAMGALYEEAAARGLHVDHIVPLRSPVVCGLHCESNMQLLTPAENIRKGNRHWPDMWEPA